MYVTVRRYEGVSDPSEVARHVNEGFLPIISEVSGFVDYYFADAQDGVMISVSVFEDQSGAEESNRRAADYIAQQNLASLMPNPPQITAAEVVAHKAAVSGVTDTVGDTVGGVTGTVGGVTGTVGGVTGTVGGATDSVRGVTDNLLGGGGEKQR
jgi:hypothetical protein